jgi:hypothetical protein
LVEAAEFIEENCDMEGLFRKSGSINRQKEMKVRLVREMLLALIITFY